MLHGRGVHELTNIAMTIVWKLISLLVYTNWMFLFPSGAGEHMIPELQFSTADFHYGATLYIDGGW